MPDKNKDTGGYARLTDAIAAGYAGNFYIFHGDERYLLDRLLSALRKLLCPGGLDSFNYKRFEGKAVSADGLSDAINTLPSFADRTLVEIHDFDIFKEEHRQRLHEILTDLPDYVCLVLVYDTIPYKPDGRVKLNAEILKKAEVVRFDIQEQSKLTDWIRRHFADYRKKIGKADAEYLAVITGGLMSSLHGEIGKVASYSKEETVTRADIDAVVIPVLDAVTYKLSNALVGRNHEEAMRILDELLQMREAPHKLIYSISLNMRQLLAARICIDSGFGRSALMDMCDIRHDFIARSLLDTARGMTLAECRDAVLFCSQTAYELNSSSEPESRLIELVAKLALHC